MCRAGLKKGLCIGLILALVGCRSDYHLNLHSEPPGAAVIIEQNRYGTTPCELEIPTDNELVRDGSLTVRYVLPDGRGTTVTYDLDQYKPPNVLGAAAVAIFGIPGVVLICLGDTDDDDDSWPDDDDDDDYGMIAAGAGLLAVAIGIMYAFDVNMDGFGGYDIHVTLPEAGNVPTEPNQPSEMP